MIKQHILDFDFFHAISVNSRCALSILCYFRFIYFIDLRLAYRNSFNAF